MNPQPAPDSFSSNYPRPDLANDRPLLRQIASGQRQIMFCILGQVGLIISASGGIANLPAEGYVESFLFLALIIYMLFSVSRLARSLGVSQLLYILLMVVPLVSMIALLRLNDKATKRLRQAGIRVGLFGANPNSI